MFQYLIVWRTIVTFGHHAFPHVKTLAYFIQTSAVLFSHGQPQITIFQNPLSNGTEPHCLSKHFPKTTLILHSWTKLWFWLPCIHEWNTNTVLLNKIKPIDGQLYSKHIHERTEACVQHKDDCKWSLNRLCSWTSLTTTLPLWVLTVAPNHWWDLNSRGSRVPFTLIILLSWQKREEERKSTKNREGLHYMINRKHHAAE